MASMNTMEFRSVSDLVAYVRELSVEKTIELADAEIWVDDSGTAVLDPDQDVFNNPEYEGFVLKGTLNEYW